MVTIIGAAGRGISNTQSAFSAYTLVLAAKQYLLTLNPYWVIEATIVIVPLCILAILAEVHDDSENQACSPLVFKGDDMSEEEAVV